MLNRNRLITFLCVILATCLYQSVPAQEEQAQRVAEQAEIVSEAKKPGDFVFAPIPVLNPTLGTGLAVGVAYLYQIDDDSYPSLIGGGGFYTDKGSNAFGLAQSANFHGNDWKVSGGVIEFDLDLEFYGIGSGAGDRDLFLPINQQGWAAGTKVLRRIKGPWYGGISYLYLKVNTRLDMSLPPDFPVELPPPDAFDSAIATLGLVGEYDTRDSQFSATRGGFFEASFSTSNKAVGSDFDFSSINLSYNHYWSLREDLVLAVRGYGCAAPGDAPYYALCKFGIFPDLRGYVGGRYRDETMLTGQAEIRWRFAERFSAVGFAGAGQVAESLSDYDLGNLLPSVGVGLRYLLSPDNGLNISIDYAYGEDSDAVYFFVGESF